MVLATAYLCFAALGPVIAIMAWNRGNDAVGLGLVFVGIGVPLGLFHWLAAKGAKTGTRWGRNMSRVFGVFALFGFPIGTILGIYVLGQTGAKWVSGVDASSISGGP